MARCSDLFARPASVFTTLAGDVEGRLGPILFVVSIILVVISNITGAVAPAALSG